MRILHLMPSFQHPTMRGPSRHYHFVRELSSRHRITLLALTRSDVPPEAMAEMESYTEEIFTFRTHAGAPTLPGARLRNEMQVRSAVARMRRQFQELLTRKAYDVVLFHGKHLYPVIADCPIPIVADFCDATSMRVATKLRFAPWTRKPLLWLRHQQVKRLERDLAGKTRHVAFISARDRHAVLGPHSDAVILPNGVDHRYWKRSSQDLPKNHSIIFTGVMDYAPNEDGALHLIQDIAPLLRRAVPDLEILIVGRDPSRRLRQAASQSPGVQVTGFVDDMRPYLERAAVCVAPLRYASGMQNKVLEALAMQVPVVSTSVVTEGLQVGGVEAPVLNARTAAEFAEATVRLLKSPDERARLSMRGRRFVENNFCWRRSAEQLERMFKTAVAEAREGATHPAPAQRIKEVSA
jgi:glycosyltransferase involved in cell wall biosynthesis